MRTPLLEAITAKMHEELGATGASVDAVYYCLHHPSAIVSEYRIDCQCRKPRPGLLLRAAATLGIDCGSSYLIGDGLTDIAAGRSAGCTTVWIGNFRCDVCRVMDRLETRPDYVAQSLSEAVEIIAKREELNGTR